MNSIVQTLLDRLLKPNVSRAAESFTIEASQLEDRVLFSAAPVPTEVITDAGAEDTLGFATMDAESEFQEFSQSSGADNSAVPADVRRELVFVDASAEDYQQLVDDLLNNQDENRDIEVILLDADRDGIEQITQALARYDSLDAIHLVSHGTDGAIKLGNTWLNSNNIAGYASQITGWNDALAADADLLLYGCDVASNESGRILVEVLGELSGCDVAASTDDTGHWILGGDWQFEYTTGNIETGVAFSLDVQQNWGHVLDVTVGNTAVGTTAQNVGSSSISFNAGAGTDQLLLVGVSFGEDKGDEVANITFDGVGLTRIGQHEDSSAPDKSRVEIWALVNPASGNKSLDITYSGTSHEGAVFGVMSFNNVDQTTPLGSFVWSEGDSPTQSVTVPSAPTEMVFGVLAYSDSTDYEFTATTGTERWEDHIDKANGTGSTQATGARLSVDASWSTTTNNTWSAGGISIRSSATSGAPVINNLAGDTLNYSEDDPATVIEQGVNVTVIDGDSANFAGGLLHVSITSGGDPAEDILGIRNQGTANGQIGVSGSDITYNPGTGAVTIGSFSGGSGGADLLIALNNDADEIATAALIENVTYLNSDTSNPTTSSRNVRFQLYDGDGGVSLARDTTVNVTRLNDPPTSSNNTVVTDEDAFYTFNAGDFAFADVDIGDSFVQIQIKSLETAGDLELSGLPVTLDQVITVGQISNLTFTPQPDQQGAGYDSFTFKVYDGTEYSTANYTMTVDVTPKADTPSYNGPTNTDEDVQSTAFQLQRNAVDGIEVTHFKITGITNGTLYYNDGVTPISNGTFITFADGNTGLKFTPTADYSGSASFNFQASATGNDSDLSAVVPVAITVDPVNDAPVNSLPLPQTVAFGFPKELSAANGNLISISDIDAGVAPLQVTLNGTKGTITLDGTTGLSFITGDGTDDSTMTFTGTISAINAALDGLTFTGTVTGAGGLQIITDDQGNTGSPGAQTDDDTLSITINATATILDLLDSSSYSRNDGMYDWSAPWHEIGESNGPFPGNVHIGNAFGETGLFMWQDGKGAMREADLSGATHATLSFDYARFGLDDPSDFIAVEVSSDGGGAWFELDRFEGPADDLALQSASYDLRGHLADNTQIRFVTSGMNATEALFVDNVQIEYSTAIGSLWFSTVNDVTVSGIPELGTWTDGHVVQVGNPDLSYGPATDGTFSTTMNLSPFFDDGDVDIDALHIVRNTHVINGVTLNPGDLLFSTNHDEDIAGVPYTQNDLLVFHPDKPGDYTAGTIEMVVDDLTSWTNELKDIALVEQDITVGGWALKKGDILITRLNADTNDILHYDPSTDSINATPFLDGFDIGIDGNMLRGIELVESTVTVGGYTVNAGRVLATVGGSSDVVGNSGPTLSVQTYDVFELDVQTAGSATVAAASMFFDGSSVLLDSPDENLYPIALYLASGGDREISGTIYEDVAGDGTILADELAAGVTIHLYDDSGAIAGEIDGTDPLLFSTATDVSGNYSFTDLTDGTYWVVVDSTTLAPSSTFNPTYGQGDVWAEQTYGSAGSVSFNGSYSYTGAAGTFYGGMQSEVSDNASALTSAEHVTRVIVAGVDATNVDSGFSFNVITNTGDDGAPVGRSLQGSFRQFLFNSVAIDNTLHGINSSEFAIPTSDSNYNVGTGTYKISPIAALPDIDDPIFLDATTQPGYTTVPIVELDGSSAVGTDGMRLVAGSDGSTIRGLIINRFDGDGIEINNSDANTIAGNYIGVDVTGSSDQGNGLDGIRIEDSANNLIGGIGSTNRNVISGNDVHGLRIIGATSTNNDVQGNYIGTNAAGTSEIGNSLNGVWIAAGANNNTLGGSLAGMGNLISGNDDTGLEIEGSTTTANSVLGNYIGTDWTGTLKVENVDGIIVEDAANNVIGGLSPDERNVISGNSAAGVVIFGTNATGNVVQNNYIGVDATGSADLGNGDQGVLISNQGDGGGPIGAATGNSIGGSVAGAGNVIAGNDKAGIQITGGAASNAVQGNFIGTNASGAPGLGNTLDGIQLTAGANNNTIGGTTADERNVISGNLDSGIYIDGVGTTLNDIWGNYIGVDVGGSGALGNNEAGINIRNGASNNTVGGLTANKRNIIAYNGWDGVRIRDAAGVGNAVLGNSIYGNTDLGINLDNAGVLSNDDGDLDAGENDMQNFPVITRAITDGSDITISGWLNSLPGVSYRVEFFTNSAADGSGYGEGETFIDFVDVTTDVNGVATFNHAVTFTVAVGEFISATATNAAGSTSEFSLAVEAKAEDVTVDGFWVSTDGDVGSPSGAPGLDSWTEGEALSFGGTAPPLSLGPGTTNGSFASALNLDLLGDGNVDIDGLHYVTETVTLAGGVTLDAGDILFSTADDEDFFGATFSVEQRDIVWFKPIASGEYSVGTMQVLLDLSDSDLVDPDLTGITDIWGFTLVERDTAIGGYSLDEGDFLFSRNGGAEDNDVYLFDVSGVLEDTTAGTAATLIEGTALDNYQKVYGLELIESTVTVGGTLLPTGALLMTLENGTTLLDTDADLLNDLPVSKFDIFQVDITQTELNGGTLASSASIIFDGANVSLDSGQENLNALTLPAAAPANTPPVATDNSNTIAEDAVTPVTGNLITDDDGSGVDSDPNLDPMTVSQIDGVTDAATDVFGSYGRLDWEIDGAYAYTIDNLDANVQALAVGETLVDTFTYTLSDPSSATDTATLTITITGTNDAPQITGGPDNAGLTETNAGLTTSGTLTVSDVDQTDLVTAAVDSVAVSGTGAPSVPVTLTNPILQSFLTVTPAAILDGTETTDTLTWDFNSGTEAFDFLATGETLILTYTVSATDDDGTPLSDTETVTITITGSNDAPVITGGPDSAGLTETNAGLTTSGTLTVSDVDQTDLVTAAVDSVAVSGTGAPSVPVTLTNPILQSFLTVTPTAILDGTENTDTLTWDFNSGTEAFDFLATGETLILTYTVSATDDDGTPLSDTETVTITITGSNDAPVITGGPNSAGLTETDAGLTTSGTLTVSDADQTDLVTAAVDSVAVSGTGAPSVPVTLTNPILQSFLTVTPTAILDGTETTDTLTWDFNSGTEAFDFLATGETLILTYTVSATDDDGTPLSDTETVTITITGSNDAPVITGGPDAAGLTETDAGLTTSGTLTISDADQTDLVTAAVDSVTVGGTGAPSVPPTLTNPILQSFLTVTPAAILDGTETTDTLTWDFNSGTEAFDFLATGETLILTYTVSATDDDGTPLVDTETVTITITGSNDAPTATANQKTITEDTVPPVAGNVITDDDGFGVDSDPDTSDLPSVTQIDAETDPAVDLTGAFGTLDWEIDGSFSYTLDTANTTVQALAPGQTLTDTFTYTLSDGSSTDTATLTIQIDGVNDDPLVFRNAGLSVQSGDMGTISKGLLEAFDVDNPPAELTFTVTGGLANGWLELTTAPTISIGSFTQAQINAGQVVYFHDGLPSVTDSITLDITDTQGGSYLGAVFNITIQDEIAALPDFDSTDEATAISVPAPGMLGNDTNINPDFTPGMSLNYDAQEDTDGDNRWEDTTNVPGYNWDFSGSGVTRTVVPTNAPPGIGAAYEFNGGGGGIMLSLQTLPGDPSNNSASFEIWFNPSASPGQEVLVEFGTSGGGTSLTLNGNTLEFLVDDVPAVALLTADLSSEIAADQYIQVVGVIQRAGPSSNLELYVNGSLADSDVVAGILDWDEGFQAGLGQVDGLINSTNTGNFQGEIGIFRFYETDLTATEVQANYDAETTSGLTVTSIDTSGTVGLVGFLSDGSFTYDPDGKFESLAAGETATDTFTYTVTDGTYTTATTVTITINGLNDAPTITGGPDAVGLIETDTGLTTSGTLTVSDADQTDLVTAAVDSVTVGGTGVTSVPAALTNPILQSFLTVTPAAILDGTEITDTLSWDFDSGTEAFDFLATGETLILTYTVSATDDDGTPLSDTETVTITITGTNDAPVITGGPDSAGLTETDSGLTTSGTLTVSDADQTDLVTAAVDSVTVGGTGAPSVPPTLTNPILQSFLTVTPTAILDGTETTDTLSWDFDSGTEAFDFLATGETLILAYTVSATDDDGTPLSDTETVTITITGSNDAPVITGGPDSAGLTETDSGLTTSGTLTVSDADQTDLVTAAVDSVTVGGTGAPSVPPTLTNPILQSFLTVTPAAILDGSETTDNLSWDFDSGTEAFDFLATGETLILTYTVSATDDDGTPLSDIETVTITIIGSNDAPVITGGPDSAGLTETDSGLTTSGTLTASDADQTDLVTAAVDSVTVGGTGASIVPPTLTNPILQSFLTVTPTAILDGTETTDTLSWDFDSGTEAFDFLATGETLILTYTVSATDDDGTPLSDTETVTITITGSNDAPVITGGPDSAGLTETDSGLTTSGTLTVSDADQTDLVTAAVDSVTLGGTGAPSVPPTLTNPILQSFLTVTPAAILDGTETTDTLSWDFDSGTEAFDFLATGETLILTYTVSATDDDGTPLSDTETVTITISGSNDAPVITGGPDSAGLTETDAGLTTSGTLTVSDADQTDLVTAAVDSVAVSGTGAPSVPPTLTNPILQSFLTVTPTAILDGSETTDTMTWDFDSGTEAFDFLATGETLILTYTVSATDDDGTPLSDTETVTITITGSNDAPVITGGPDSAGLTETDAGLTTSGTLTVSDADLTDLVTAAVDSVAVSGTGAAPSVPPTLTNPILQSFLTVTPTAILDGTETTDTLNWDFDSGTEAFDFLATGETLILTYTVSATDDDGTPLSDTETVTITITGTNDAPVITGGPDAAGLTETDAGLTTSGTLTVSDADQTDLVTAAVDSVAVSGTGALSVPPTLTNPILQSFLTVTPTAILDGSETTDTLTWDFDSGTEAFDFLATSETLILTYTVSATDDGGTPLSDTETVTITITGSNDAPVITGGPDSAGLTETDAGLTTSGTLTVSDADLTDLVTAAVDSIAVSGTGAPSVPPTLTNPILHSFLTVTPTAILDGTETTDTLNWDFDSGTESFDFLATGETLILTYTVSATDDDGTPLSDTETVTITITGTNDDPIATANSNTIGEDAVAPVNGNVIADDDSFGVDSDADTSDVLTVTQFDAETDPLNDVTGSYGTLDWEIIGTYSYTVDNANPDVQALAVGETLTDTFSYRISDGNGGTDMATLTITIDGQNDDPTAADDTGFGFNTDEDTAFITADVRGNDSDPDTSDVLSVVGLNTGGTLGSVINNGDGTFTYDPSGVFEMLEAGQTATDTFSYTIDDGNGGTDTATVTIRIDGRNDVPVANADSASVNEGGTVNIDLTGNDSDVDDGIDPGSISIIGGPSHGTLVINADGTVDYNHNGSETTTDSFTYRIRDLSGTLSNPAVVDIAINPQNDPPVAGDDAYTTKDDTTLTATVADGVQANDNDAENDPLNTTVVTGPANGTLTLNADGSLTYTPDAGFIGTDSFTYKANDGTVDSNTATVTIEVQLDTPPPTVDTDPEPVEEEEEEATAEPTPEPPPADDPEPPPSITPPSDPPVETPTDDGAPRIVIVDETEDEEEVLSNLLRDFGRPDIKDPRYLTPPQQLLKTFIQFNEGITLDGAFEFFEQLDSLEDLMNSQTVMANVTAGSAGVISLGLSAGYAFITNRAGTLVTSLLTSMPAWRVVDPLPVLAYLDDDDDEDDLLDGDKNETLESIVENASAED